MTIDLTGGQPPAFDAGLGSHHPSVERWRNIVAHFFGAAGFPDETDYALMVMWGESQGDPSKIGNALTLAGRRSRGVGLYQHPEATWRQNVLAARQWWSRQGTTISTDPTDPVTSIATAAFLRAQLPGAEGWGFFGSTWGPYPPGAFGSQTSWNGYEYDDVAVAGVGVQPAGDGQAASYPFRHPLPGTQPNAGGIFGVERPGTDGGVRQHDGIDLNAPQGTPILATLGGRVIEAGPSSGVGGLNVKIDHGGGWVSSYFHIMEGGVLVNEGDRVQPGQQIGRVGHTGNAATDHLHFELRFKGNAVDPVALGTLGDETVAQITGQPPLPQPQSRSAQARQLLGGTLDAISRQVAGGTRLSLDQVVGNRLTPDSLAEPTVEEEVISGA